MNRNWNISDPHCQTTPNFRSYLEFVDSEIDQSSNPTNSQTITFDIIPFIMPPFASSGFAENPFETFQNKLGMAQNQIVIILDGFKKVLLRENSLLLREIVEGLYYLTDSSKMLFEGKIFDCLKILLSYEEAIIQLGLEQVRVKFSKIIEVVRNLSMEALYNRQYQNRTRKTQKKQSFSSRVLEMKRSYSPCLSIDKEHMEEVNDKLLKTIRTELTLASLQEFMKTYSISESDIVSEICRIYLKYHVKKCSEKYKAEKELEEIRVDIIGMRQSMKNREIQLKSEINHKSQNSDQKEKEKTEIISSILKILIRDFDKRSLKNYHSKTRQIQNLLDENSELIVKDPLLFKYSSLFKQERELKARIQKLAYQNLKGSSQTDTKRSKYSQKRSLDTFNIKTPPKKNNKKSRFAAAKKEEQEEKDKDECYFSEKVNRFPLVRKHSSQKLIHNHEEDFRFKNFEVLKLLGKGAFGRVYLVRRIMTRDLYAMKVIPMQSAQYSLIKNEHDIFAKISGDSFVRAVFSFTEGNLHMFFLEYMDGGDFAQLLEREVYFEEGPARSYVAQIALAIERLHETGIIHRDIKPANIVLDSKGCLKLTDFGLSKLGISHVLKHSSEMSEAKHAEDELISSQPQSPPPSLLGKNSTNKKTLLRQHTTPKKRIIGTPDYIPPEIIKQESFDNPTIDWWSFGVIIYEALIGQKPFGAQKMETVFDNILALKIIWPEIGYGEGMISPEAQDLIKRLLEPDFTKRLGFNGIEEVKTHPFWQGFDWNNVGHMIPPIKVESEDLSLMDENSELKRQIEELISKETQQNSSIKLKSLVRLDVLSETTLSRASISSNENRKRTRKSCFAQLRQ